MLLEMKDKASFFIHDKKAINVSHHFHFQSSRPHAVENEINVKEEYHHKKEFATLALYAWPIRTFCVAMLHYRRNRHSVTWRQVSWRTHAASSTMWTTRVCYHSDTSSFFNIVNQAIDFVLKSEANLKISAVDTCLKIEVTSEDSTAFSSIVQLSKWSEAAVEENLEVKMSVIEAFV